jgi:hypothetical protein
MPRSNKVISIPVLNDFIYTLLSEATYEQKRGLSGRYLKAAMNSRSARAFATSSTREEKEILLSHFGLDYFYVISGRSITFKKLKDILTKFETGKKVKAIADIAESGIFVTSDVEFLKLLGLMSQSIHNPNFFLNVELSRIAYNIKKWKKTELSAYDLEIREMQEDAKTLCDCALNMDRAMVYHKGLNGVSGNELRVLLYLYKNQGYISDSHLAEYFHGVLSKLQFRYAIKQLFSSQAIIKNIEQRTEYTISGIGVKHVNNFLNNFTGKNQF